MIQLYQTFNRLLILLPVILFCLSGCLSQHRALHSPIEYEFNITTPFKPECNIIIILDASASMGTFHNEELKIKIATSLLNKINSLFNVARIKIALSMITIGKTLWPLQTKTEIVIPLHEYNYSTFAKEIKRIKWTGGESPLADAITNVYDIASKTIEPLLLIIITDAEGLEKSPVFPTENLKMRFQNRLCIHTIQIGNYDVGTRMLKKISNISGCGLFQNSDSLKTNQQIREYVKQILLPIKNKQIPSIKQPIQKKTIKKPSVDVKSTSNDNLNQKRIVFPKKNDTWDEYRKR